jgi:2',3'-cyclic-nucleotide 2'-phosphodiesterase (5'-nucleotidase family)
VVLLHTNDFHGKLSRQLVDKLLPLREQADFYFDSGDCIATGNVGIPLKPEPAWGYLDALSCTASVPGNREFHVTEAGFRAKLAGAKHPVLAANLHWKNKPSTHLLEDSDFGGDGPLQKYIILDNVAVFGLMVPMVTKGMAARHISAFVNTPAIDAARNCVNELRQKVDMLIALTHIGLARDKELAVQVPGIDLILGGHSHDVLHEPIQIGKTWICQAGSHGRFAGLHRVSNGAVTSELIDLQS